MSEFKILVKNTSSLVVTRLVQFIAGLLRVKISAIFLGTFGMGIVDQLTFLTNKLSQFTTVGTVEAFVKQIAENKDKEDVNELICSSFKSYILVIFGFVLFSTVILLFFSSYLTEYIFGEDDYKTYFYIALFTFPILVLGSLPFSVLKAFKDIKAISISRIWIVITQMIIAVPIIYIYKLPGAVAYVPLSYIIDFCFLFYFANKFYLKKYKVNFKSILSAPFVPKFLKELFLFSGFGITVGIYLIVSEFICRSIVVTHLGVDSIGLYSPVIMWASIFTGFILPSLSTYLYPRFCQIKENSEISMILNDALRLSTLCLMPLLLLGIPFRQLFISIFYTQDFISACQYLPYHFIGITFYVWWYVFSQSLTPTGRIKIHGFFRIGFFSLDILTTYIFVKHFGLYGWMLKHIISPFVFFWVYAYYSKTKMNFKIRKSNVVIMLYLLGVSVTLITILQFVPNGDVINFFIGPALLMTTILILTKAEKKYLKQKLNTLKSQFRI